MAQQAMMTVYRTGEKEKNLLLQVQPGKEIDSAEYKDEEGLPLMMSLQFKDGALEVSEQLGQWLVDKGLAVTRNRYLAHVRSLTERMFGTSVALV